MEYAYSSDTLILNNQRPVHWTLVRLRNLLKECNNQVGSRKDLPLLSLTKKGVILRDIDSGKGKFPKDFESYKIVEPDHLIFCLFDIDETPRTVGLSNLNGMITGAYDVFNISEMVNKHFIYYYFLAVDDQKALRPYYSGLRKVVQLPKFLGIQIPIPPLDEQKKIVEYLSTKISQIDAQQRERKRELHLLDKLKQAEIANVVTRGLNPDVPMKDSGIPWIGQIPAHWTTRRIKYLFKEEDEKNTDLSFQLLTFSRKKGIIPFSDANEKAPSAFDLSNYKVIRPGQLLENRMQAWSGMFAKSEIEGCVSPDYSVFSAISDDICVDFFAHLFRTNQYIAHWANLSRGVGEGFNRLYTNQFHSVYALFPPVEEQRTIVEYIQQKNAAIDEMIANLRAEIEFLTEYKQRLIADVVTGQVNVQNL